MLLATGGSAQAAAPWSAPLTIGPPSNGSQVQGLGFDNRGAGVVGWRLGASGYVASLSGDGVVGPPRRLPAELAGGPALASGPPLPTPPGASAAIVFLRRLLPPTRPGASRPDRTRLSWALVGADATLGTVHPLTTAQCLTCRVTLAVNWLGEAVAVWSEERGIRASWRPAGGRFGAPVTLFKGANGQISGPQRGDRQRRSRDRRRGRRSRTRAGSHAQRTLRADACASAAATRARRCPRRSRTAVRRSSRGAHRTAARRPTSRGSCARHGCAAAAGASPRRRRSTAAAPSRDRRATIALAFTPGGKATVAWSAVAAPRHVPGDGRGRQARWSLRRAAAARAVGGRRSRLGARRWRRRRRLVSAARLAAAGAGLRFDACGRRRDVRRAGGDRRRRGRASPRRSSRSIRSAVGRRRPGARVRSSPRRSSRSTTQ